jgi:hypothetical protein
MTGSADDDEEEDGVGDADDDDDDIKLPKLTTVPCSFFLFSNKFDSPSAPQYL